jgi:hypothetical protein
MIARATGKIMGTIWCLYAALVVTSAAIAGDGTVGATVNGIEIGKATPPSKPAAGTDDTTQATCLSHCAAADTRCNSEVRRARSECSRSAATPGRTASGNDPFGGVNGSMSNQQPHDPYTGRRYNYAYFCDYFNNGGRNCGNDRYSQGCQMRFANRYSLCINTMDNNIASQRFDCYKNEKDAQNYCRDELRDCQAACK